MYGAGYEFRKHTYSILVDPDIISAPTDPLSLNAVNLGLDSFVDELEHEYLVGEYDDSTLDSVDESVIDEVLIEEDMEISSSISDVSSTAELPLYLGFLPSLGQGC